VREEARYQALIQRGLEAMRNGSLREAQAAFEQVTSVNPKEHRAWHMLAVIALNASRPHEAVAYGQRALLHDRRNVAYLNTLGIAAAESGMFEEAIGHFRRALREKPAFADAAYNLGKSLVKIGDLKGARDAYRRAMAFDARRADVRKSLAWVLRVLGDLDEAIRLLEEVAAETPDDDQVFMQLAIAYRERGGIDAAFALFRAALERRPASAVLHAGLARLYLARGEWRQGWTEYLWRDRVPRADDGLPQWGALSRDLSGMRIRLVGEQGLGDTLFFARYVPELARRGAALVLECLPKLTSLLRRSPLFEDVVPPDGAGSTGTELRVFVGDLPALLGAEGVAPAFPVTADPDRVARHREVLERHGEPPFIGVTWRGGTDPREPEFGRRLDTLFKEVELDAFAAAVDRVPGTIVVLQRQPRPEELARFARRAGRVPLDLSALNDDLEEMTALLAALDDYVGVSNTNMHLTAGLGRAARVLVPDPPEWRWMEAGDESPWFPGFRVYRQTPQRSWDAALARLASDLRGLRAGPVSQPAPSRGG
jgi:tetratricopeptide (TPR) repeat protein